MKFWIRDCCKRPKTGGNGALTDAERYDLAAAAQKLEVLKNICFCSIAKTHNNLATEKNSMGQNVAVGSQLEAVLGAIALQP